MKKLLLLTLAGMIMLAGVSADTPPLAPATIAAPVAVAPPKVIAIKTLKTTESQEKDAVKQLENTDQGGKLEVAYPGNIIRFTISNPKEFLKIRPNDRSKVVIYVNGLEMSGMSANWYRGVTNQQISGNSLPEFKNNRATIDIVLKRNDTTQRAWVFFYNNTKNSLDNFVEVDASIGWEGMSSLEKETGKVGNLRIVYYKMRDFFIYLGFFICLLVGFALLAFKTNAIKEGDSEGAYSLSLTQLLFWTTLTIGAFIYTLVLTDITSSFNSSILYMLGISLSTTGVATVIDSQFREKNNNQVKKPHSNFFKDILSSDGVSFSVQRLQIFAWNLVLGIYFIVYTLNNKSMPVFSETMLVLAGFSSLSYLGAKQPENAAIKRDKEEKVLTPDPVAVG
jgi:hypothetical protein